MCRWRSWCAISWLATSGWRAKGSAPCRLRRWGPAAGRIRPAPERGSWPRRGVGLPTEAKHRADGSVFYVSSIGVLPEYRGQGLGRGLMASALEVARSLGCDESVLVVSEAWLPARAIYAGLGFRELERLAGFFTPRGRPPEAGIVMWRSLRDG